MTEVEKAIKADLSADESYKHMTFLVEKVGERLAGTKSIEKAADYIRQELESFGLGARIDRFPIYHSYPGSAALRVTYPEDRVIETRPCCHISSTLDEGLTGELVYAGVGGYEDYKNIEAKDKIILTDMTWAPPRPEKARIAFEKKAKALIVMNWGTPDNPVIQMGAIKSVLGTSVPHSRSVPEVREFLLEVVSEVWGEKGSWDTAYKGGDQSFFGVGVPYIGFATGYTREELERLNWASLSPWLHSEADTIDKVDKKLFERHLHLFATLVLRLCNSEMIPYDLSQPVGLLKSHLESLKNLSRDIESIELDSLTEKVEQLDKSVQTLNEYKRETLSYVADVEEETVRLINEVSIKMCRELSYILWTEASKYDQDAYGYYLVGKPIPRLHVPIMQMRELEQDDKEFNLWTTKFMRERNRVSDAIGNAIECLALTTRLLEELSTTTLDPCEGCE